MALYVTDTHPLIWYASGETRRLSRRSRRIFQQADEQEALVYVPAAVLWEVAFLARRGRIQLDLTFGSWVRRVTTRGFECSPLNEDVVVEASSLGFTRDPFDAAIVATALRLDLPLITKDAQITDAGIVAVAW